MTLKCLFCVDAYLAGDLPEIEIGEAVTMVPEHRAVQFRRGSRRKIMESCPVPVCMNCRRTMLQPYLRARAEEATRA